MTALMFLVSEKPCWPFAKLLKTSLLLLDPKQTCFVKLLSRNNETTPLDLALADAVLIMVQESATLLASVSVTVGVCVLPDKLLQLAKETGMSICEFFIKPWAVSLMPDNLLRLTSGGMLRLQVADDGPSTLKLMVLGIRTSPFKSALL